MKKLSYSFLFLLALTSCVSTKHVPEESLLLRKTTLVVDGEKNRDKEAATYLIQRPNATVFGWPLSLHFYNLGDPAKNNNPEDWRNRNPKLAAFITRHFSNKQTIGLANSSNNFNQWLLKKGEAPVIIAAKKTQESIANLQAFYSTQGYFKAAVHAEEKIVGKKKGALEYLITKGKPLFLDSITVAITSPAAQQLYNSTQEKSYLQTGNQYKDVHFIQEAARLTKLFRNNGLYHFSENYIGFYDIDTTRADYKTNLTLQISDRLIAQGGGYVTKPLQVQTIQDVAVYTDYSYTEKDQPYLDSISYKGITFYSHKKLAYKPKYLAQSIFIKPQTVYSDSLRDLTRKHLRSLKNFKTTTLKFTAINDSTLTAAIYLSPIEKFTVGLETEVTHSNIRNLGLSGKFSLTNRNTFKGAELLNLSFIGSFFNTSLATSNNNDFFNSWEFGVDASLEFPRLIAPFGLSKLVSKSMSPKTLFSVGTSLQKNIGLDKQAYTTLIDYKWQYSPKQKIEVELFNTQYLKNLNTENYFSIYSSEFLRLNSIAQAYYNDTSYQLPTGAAHFQEIVNFMNTVSEDSDFSAANNTAFQENLNIKNRYAIITSNFIIPTVAYSYTYNDQSNFKDTDFTHFKIRLANSGNFLGALSKKTDNNGHTTLFNTPLAQYFKTDIEYKRFWKISNNAVLGFRTSLGAIVPYGGSSIPFTKSYFAGGSNDIRGWKTYDLGPGSRAPGLEYNIGSLKLVASLEYRFNLIGSFKGALFVDAGNIWDISSTSFVDDSEKFTGIGSLKNSAIATGAGLRYDFDFLVLRLDAGLKTYEPYITTGSRWFQHYTLNEIIYNVGINYPF